MKLILFVTFMFAGRVLAEVPSPDIVFIVNSENPVEKLSVEDIRNYYMKKKRRWPDGTNVRFLDRSADSGLRKTFLAKILEKTADEVDLHWIGQKLYTGDAAPLKEASDAMAVQFVGAFKGAISYVRPETPLSGKNVKAVKVE